MMEIDMSPDPVIEVYKKDVDDTLLRENLKLTPEQRVRNLMALQEFIEEVQRAGRQARRQARAAAEHPAESVA